MVPDPFEIIGNLERGGEHAEVASHRLLESEQVDTLLLDLHFHGIDCPVPRNDRLRLLVIALQQRLDRQLQRSFRLTGHGEQAYLDLRQFLVEVAWCVAAHPNLPVMYVRFGPFLLRRREDLVGLAEFDEHAAPVEEPGEVGDACRLLHVVRHDHDRVVALQLGK